ncbi:hypothetical protein HPG69_012472 [Diceros bicornis minor]|uniref:NTR domain-containing protein n=1 Tax=Diceros bicornis minor TaxID=77932 RepID=A0A7J7F896_DICBM|nr:hypothetical protein HPG69_012472 [Diceros bicornis minor]
MATLSWALRRPTDGCPSTAGAAWGRLVGREPELGWRSLDRTNNSSWPPAPNQCDLNCLAEGHAFYHSFGRVLDGTPCSPGTQGLCVAGRCLVLLQEPNPGIEFEFWLPRERYGPFQAQAQALGWSLRQPQPREVEPQPPEPHAGPAASPPRTPTPAPGWGKPGGEACAPDCAAPADPCPPCPDTRGRAHRLLHYCGSDFVFQARVLGRLRQAQETRYEVRVQLVYKNRSPLQALEYVWAPGRCPCPPLALHREYLLAARRLVSPDGTQDRLLLPHAGYARPWSPAEDSRIRLVARHCPV